MKSLSRCQPFVWALLIVVALAACVVHTNVAAGAEPSEYIDIPLDDRVRNHTRWGSGSCNWVSLQSALNWHGLHEHASYIGRKFGGAASVWDLKRGCDKMGLDYAWTHSGNVKLLERASETRRPAAMHFLSRHACTFLGFYIDDDGNEHAAVLDPNRTKRLRLYPRKTFEQKWRAVGGNALVLAYPARPPKPIVK